MDDAKQEGKNPHGNIMKYEYTYVTNLINHI